LSSHPASSDRVALRTAGISILAVACCAGLPLLAALAGGIGVAALLGIGSGALVLLAAVVVAVMIARARRRSACNPDSGDRAPS
jgi:hypothetical protein